MKQAFKKVLAIVLTVAMIQGTGGFFSFADTTDAARDAESAQPGVTVEEREVTAEDPGTEESGAQEEKAEEPQEASGQSGDEDGQAEEAVTDQKEQEEQAGSEADQEGSEAGQAEERSDEEAEEKAEEKTAYEYSDDKIQVNVVISDPSAVPDSARLVVTPVTAKTEGYSYDAYMDALNGKAEKGQEYTKDNTLLYDIAFMDGGKEIEPAEGSVNVQVKFKDKQLSEGLNATAKDDVQIMHLPLKNSVQEGFATTAEATEIEAADIKVEPVDAEVSVGKKESTSFTTKTFSVWAWSNGAASTIKIPEIEGEFGPGAPQYELNGPFGSLANFGVVGFSEIVQNDHLHSNFATKNYVMNSAVGFGLRDKRNGVTNTHKELYYIGESLTGDASTSNMEIHVPDSLLVFGHDLGENGRLIAAPNDDTYDINVSGRNIHITSGEAAAKRDGSGYSATSIRQEPEGSKYVDLDKMKAEAEKLSKTLSDRTASEVTVTPGENNVLIVESPNATIGCMNFNASDFEGKTLKIDEASIANREHLLIINIDAAGAGSITLPQLELQNAGGIYNGEVVEWTKGNVVVNVIDSTKPDKLFRGTVNTVSGLFQASILAPDANVIVKASVNGQVFGDRVELNMEFHRDSITFKNSIPSVGGIRVAKTMDGSNIVKPDTYSFKLEGLNYNGHQAPMPDGSNGNVKTMYAQADGLVSFGFLNFSEDEFNAGVRDYRYRVSEVIPSNATDIGDGYKLSGDVAYDSSQYIIELHTKRSSSGGLSIGGYTVYESDGKTKIAEMTYEESKTSGVATFDNKSLSNQSKIILKVKKAFNSDEWPEEGFGFDLTKVGVDYGQGIDSSQLDNMPPEKWRIDSTYEPQKFYTHITATKDKPTAVFREIEYNRTGTYYYKIKETIPAGATVSPDGKTAVKDGITYDRTEHDVAVTIKQINGKNIASVKYDGKNSLAIENKVVKQTGNLELTKTIKGDITEEEAEGALTFVVKTKDGKYLDKDGKLSDQKVELTLADFQHEEGTDKYTFTAEGIDIGEYTVTETTKTIDGKDVTTTYKVNGGEAATGDSAEAEVKKDETTTVAFEDDYTKQTGNLELTKTIKGDITEEEAEGALTFVVKTEDGKYLDKDGKLVESEKDVVLTLADFQHEEGTDKYTFTAEGIDIGEYTVTETTKTIDGKDVTVTYSVNGGEAKEGKAAAAEVKKGETTKVAFEDDYTKQTGNLELTKTIKGDITEEEAEGALTFVVKTKDEKYLDKDGKLVESEKDVVLTLADFQHEEGTDKYTFTAEGIDIGEYTVTETTKDINGKDVTVTYKVNGGEAKEGKAAAAEVKKDETTTVAFEDDYSKQTGNLELTKTIKGDITEEEAEGALTFVVKTKDGKYLNKEGKLVKDEAVLTLADFQHEEGTDKYTFTAEGIDIGEYTVTETTKTIDGKDVTVTYKVNDGEATEGKAAPAEVEKDKTTIVAFEDDYTKQTGNLELTKTIKGDITEEEAAGALTFVVKAENGKYLNKEGKLVKDEAVLTLADFQHEEGTKEYTLKIEGVDLGNYTVTETTKDIDGKDVKVTYSVNGGEAKEGKEAAAEVKKDETTTVDFEDDYTKQTGNLELTKTIKGDITEEEAEGALTFVVKTEDGKYLNKEGKLVKDEAVLTLADFQHEEGTKEYTLKIEGVDLGNYTVTETTKDIDGKDVKVKYSVNGSEATEGKEAAAEVEKDKTTTVAFEDDYTATTQKESGILELTKTIKGDITEEEAEGALTFVVKAENGKYLGKDGKLVDSEEEGTLTLKDFEKIGDNEYKLTIEDVDLGNYTVTETTKDIDGKEVKVTYKVNGGEAAEGDEAEAEVKDGETTTVAFEDDYTATTQKESGILELTKTIKGDVTEEEAEGALTFVVKTEDNKYLGKDGKLSEEKVELTLKDFEKIGDNEYKLTIEDVDLGNYTVTETTKDIDGKDVTVKYSVNGGDSATGDAADFAIENGETTTVAFEDDYKDKPGDLIITKSIDGLNVTESEFEGALKFTVQNSEGKYLDKDGNLSDEKVELTLKDGGFVKGEDGTYTKTFKDVAPGKYTVTETNSDVEGYDLVTEDSTTEGEGTVKAGKAATVELKDVYEEEKTSGDLVITKSIDGLNVTESEFEGALKFTVQNEEGKYLDKDGNLSDEKVELTLKDGGFVKGEDGTYTKTFKDVAPGKYTVKETNSDVEGYDLVTEDSTTEGEGTVKSGEAATVELKDVYEEEKTSGDLVITKSIDGLNVTESEFEGALKFTVQNEEGKYLDKDGNLSDEKVELTLKDGGFVKGEDGTYTKTFKDVAPGKYTVKETNSDVEGYDLVTEESTTEGEGTVKGGKTETVELKDVYEEKTSQESGILELTKTIKGDITEEEAEGALTFVVKAENGKYLNKDGELVGEETTLTLADFQHEEGTKEYTLKIEGVDLGNYTVTETTKDIDGKDVTVKYSVNGGDSATGDAADFAIENGETTTVAFEDDYKDKPGDLVITKSIDGLNVTESEFEGALKFTVQNSEGKYLDKDGNLSDEKVELTLKDGGFVKGEDGTYTKTFKDVAPGKYTVKETNSDVEGYDLVAEESTTDGEGTVEAGKAATVELKDVYEEKTSQESGDLVITKSIDGLNVTESEFEGALKFTVQNSEGKYLDKDGNLSDEKVELTLKDGGFVKGEDGTYTKTFKDVAPGKYTVTETNSDVEGYDLVTEDSTTDGEGTVEAGKAATVELKDVYEEKTSQKSGILELTKTIKGDVTEEEAEGALTFVVMTEDGKYLDKDGKLVDSEEEGTLTLKDFEKTGDKEYKLTIKDVDLGNYTVTETTKDIDGKEVKVTYKVNGGEAAEGDEAEAEVKDGETTTVAFEDDYTKVSKPADGDDEEGATDDSGDSDDSEEATSKPTEAQTPQTPTSEAGSESGSDKDSKSGSSARPGAGARTGDEAPIGVITALMLASLTAIGGSLVFTRRRRKADEDAGKK